MMPNVDPDTKEVKKDSLIDIWSLREVPRRGFLSGNFIVLLDDPCPDGISINL